MDGYHGSVLLKETIEALQVAKDKWYLDGTLGDGGHAVEILRRGGKLLGVDVDPYALQRTKERLKDLGFDESRFRLVQGNFRDIENLIPASPAKRGEQTETKFAGALFDLGVSSLQLEDPERGFSFAKMGRLDMRMDPTLGIQALDLVNNLSGKELYELFKNLGEEKYSKHLADALVLARALKPFSTTLELANVIEKAMGGRRKRIHPATKVFQALRIAVNDELNALQEGLDNILDLIEKDGRILVISFHSLEDRIVKHKFRKWADQKLGEVVTKKPITPSDEEVFNNPRSRSAKLRMFEKL